MVNNHDRPKDYLKRLKGCEEHPQFNYCKACGRGEQNVKYYKCKIINKIGEPVCICERCYERWCLIQIKK